MNFIKEIHDLLTKVYILLLIYVSHRRRFVTAQRMTNEAVKKEC